MGVNPFRSPFCLLCLKLVYIYFEVSSFTLSANS